MSATLGALNPLRYRGYVYDSETGLYYLQSRYYDPELGRFINADGLVATGQGFTGNNMFAYCGNNPVNRLDPSGNYWGLNTGAGGHGMLKLIGKNTIQFLLLMIWGALLILQHVASFDVFETNAWHLYFITFVAAVSQYLILLILKRINVYRIYLWLYYILYIIAACWSAFLLSLMLGSNISLLLVCGILDLVGLCITWIIKKDIGQTKTGDGSPVPTPNRKAFLELNTGAGVFGILKLIGIITIQFLLLMIWGVLLNIQHGTAFTFPDVISDTNTGHFGYLFTCICLYFITIAASFSQYFILLILKRINVYRIYLWLYYILYIIAACWSVFLLLLMRGNNIVMPLICVILDLVGLCITWIIKKDIERDKGTVLSSPETKADFSALPDDSQGQGDGSAVS